MMRAFFVFLSNRKGVQRFISSNRFTRRMSRRFVAGETLEEAIEKSKDLHDRGYLVAVDHLGENVTDREGCRRAVNHYIRLIKALSSSGIKGSSVSVKLTQIGLDVGYDYCLNNLVIVSDAAKRLGVRVEVDMEASRYAADTLKIYREMRKEYDIGVCLQAYLYRSQNDLEALLKLGSTVRIVKGAYKEPKDVAIQDMKGVEENYKRLLGMSLTKDALERNSILIGTHNEGLIRHAVRLMNENRLGKGSVEFEMLYGIRDDLKSKLKSNGYKVRVYMPYGEDWYPYFMRRLAERPANLWFLLRNLFK